MKALIILLCLTTSCSLTSSKYSSQNPDFYWSILENATEQKWTKSQVLKMLGPPDEKHKHTEREEAISWFYSNRKNNFQEWVFSFDSDGIVEGVSYFPNDLMISSFSIEKIMTRWQSLNCQHKVKQVLKSHVIKKEKSLSCDNNKRTANYNRYNEVEYISVRK